MALSVRTRRRFVALASGVLAGVLGLALALLRPEVVEDLDRVAYDTATRLSARPERASDRIVMVEIDDESRAWVESELAESWPWPREYHGVLAQALRSWGAKVVAFDILFEHQSAFSDMELFAQAIGEAGNVVLGGSMRREADAPAEEAGWGVRLAAYDDREALGRAALLLEALKNRAFVVREGDRWALHAGGYRTPEDAARLLAQHGAVLERFDPSLVRSDAEVLDGGLRAALEARLAARTTELGPDAERIGAERWFAERFAVAGRPDGTAGFRIEEANRAILPVALALPAAAGIGLVDQDPDPDGVLRRVKVVTGYGGRLYPSFPLAVYLASLGDEAQVTVGADGLAVGGRTVPLDAEGRMLVRFHGAAPYRKVPAADVLRSALVQLVEGGEPEMDTAVFEDRIVIVSPSSAGLMDLKPSPVSPVHLGGDINAAALDQLLTGRWLRRAPRWLEGLLSLLLAGLAVLGSVLTGGRAAPASAGGLEGALRIAGRALLTLGAGTLGILVLLGSVWWLYAGLGLWIAPTAPLAAAVVATVLHMSSSELLERRDRRAIHEALGTYTSRAIADLVAAEGVGALAPRRADVSVYFSDIAGFTSFSERMAPEALAELLNVYLTAMTEVVLEHDGIVDKYIGDAIMAFWGAPAPVEDHALRAVKCAMGMRARLRTLRPELEARYGVTVVARAGINSGQVAVGNMGSAHKVNYTLMGDTVNLASRLEGANKAYGTVLMIGEGTYERLGGAVEVRELDLLRVKGKDEPVRVFEPLALAGDLDPDDRAWVEAYRRGLGLYRARRFAEARGAFEAVLADRPDDGPARLYLERCDHFLEAPPPADWDGVFVMTTK